MSVKFKTVSSEASGKFVFGVVLGVANFFLVYWLIGFMSSVDQFWRVVVSLIIFTVFVCLGFMKALEYFKKHYVVETVKKKPLGE